MTLKQLVPAPAPPTLVVIMFLIVLNEFAYSVGISDPAMALLLLAQAAMLVFSK